MIDVEAIRRIVEGLFRSLKTPSLRWAQVHTLSPLRIKFPGEAPLPYAPTLLFSADKLEAASRLLVAEWGGQGVVIGVSGGGTQYTPPTIGGLGGGVDLNTLTTWRTWTQGNNGNAASGSNYPVPLAGTLEVIPLHDGSGGHVWQRYTTYRHTGLTGGEEVGPTVYVRAYYSSAWSPWIVVGGEPRIAGVKSSKTYYEKYPDGRLICRGSHSFPSDANSRQTYAWTYPVAFVGELPQVTCSAGSTAPQNISMGFSDQTLTSINVEFYRTTAAATGVMFEAEGRWK